MIARLSTRSLLSALAATLLALAPVAASAQDTGEARQIWLEIFTAPTPQQQPEASPQRQRQRRTTRPAAPAAADPAPSAQIAEPAGPVEVTTRIVVFGDSLATNLGDGLAAVLEDQPQVEVVTRSRGSSGLVRDDYHDWEAAIEPFLAGEDPFDIGVVMVGLNDRQDLVVDGERLDRLTDPWKEAYAARVDAILARFDAADVPLVWVGLPPMSSSRLSTDLQALNEIVRNRVQRADGIFVDIWQGFVDDDNRYAPNGPTLEGQIGRLRAGDGIHFTPPGARKAAHFADVEIRRLIGRGPAEVAPALPVGADLLADEAVDLEDLTVDEIVARLTGIGLSREADPGGDGISGPVSPAPVVGPVLPLTGVERTPGAALARERPPTDRATRLLNERVLADGVAPPPVPGRADDFTWPRETPPQP
jgi:hypothetical protein